MQQKIFKGRAGFGAGLAVSLVAHAGLAVLFLLRLPTDQPEPQKEAAIEVEMVPAPEKKPAEKKPEKKAAPPQKEKSAEKPGQPARQAAEKKTAEKPAEAPPQQPQAFESASRDGGKLAGGGRPSEPQNTPDNAKSLGRADPKAGQETPLKAEPDLRQTQEKPDDTPSLAKPPEVDLPETANLEAQVNEGEALVETVPVPQARPKGHQPMEQSERASTDKTPSDARPQRPPSELTAATELHAADTLSDPRVRQALGKLPKERRIVQICMVEALEQIRRARPETLPQGLFFDPQNGAPIVEGVLTATGAAYRSGDAWYDVDFQCSVDAEAEAITAFGYRIGNAVPRAEWKTRRFPKD